MGLKDSKKLKMYPVKLYAEALNPPAFLSSTQYMRLSDYPGIDELVKEIVRLSTSDTGKNTG
jgi:hypothetical protein